MIDLLSRLTLLAAVSVLLLGLCLHILGKAVEDMFSEEIRTRFKTLPAGLIRIAARRLPVELRDEAIEEWQGELDAILRATDGLPITRLIRSVHYAAGLATAAPKIGRTLLGTPSAWARLSLFAQHSSERLFHLWKVSTNFRDFIRYAGLAGAGTAMGIGAFLVMSHAERAGIPIMSAVVSSAFVALLGITLGWIIGRLLPRGSSRTPR